MKMKNAMLLLRRSMLFLVAIIGAGIFLSSCLKDKGEDTDIPAAGLMAFNLAPDQQAIAITLSWNSLTQSPLNYTGYNGGYQNIYAGMRNVETFGYPANSPLATASFNFEADKYYSVFFVGKDSSYRNIIATDELDSLPVVEKAYVRYINAITDSVNTASVNITAGGSNVVTDNAVYGNVSQFTQVNPGDINISVKNNNGVDANRTIQVESKKVYTVLLLGVPGATDENQKVQIRFIQNGLLTEDNPDQ
jgi:hypothetical protein